jgi:hypothetical protein
MPENLNNTLKAGELLTQDTSMVDQKINTKGADVFSLAGKLQQVKNVGECV